MGNKILNAREKEPATSWLQRKHIAGFLLIFLVLLADQASKSWMLYGLKLPEKGSIAIAPFLNFTMVWNHAVTFGMFGGHGPALFIIISLIAVFVLLSILVRAKNSFVVIASSVIIGGALGNVIDRCLYGAVVDFLDFYIFSWHWYVFNIADSAIVCGVGLWMLEVFLSERARERELEAPSHSDGK